MKTTAVVIDLNGGSPCPRAHPLTRGTSNQVLEEHRVPTLLRYHRRSHRQASPSHGSSVSPASSPLAERQGATRSSPVPPTQLPNAFDNQSRVPLHDQILECAHPNQTETITVLQ